jgi:hypothetical protein
MKLLSWNCRGLSRPSAVRSLRMLIRIHSPDILFLSETISSPSQVSSILHSLGFYHMCQVAPIGSSGGLALSWRPGVDLDCFLSNKNHIAAWCLSDPAHSPWILSCIYGPPALREKPAFWDSITSVSDHFDCPWLCIGDLNFVLDQTEKQGGRRVASSSSCPFKKFIDHSGLVDLGFAGNPFTWCNHRQGLASIKERLDRGLASLSWIHLHPEYAITHIPATNSDHHPILLNTDYQSALLPRPFRFEAFWIQDPTCELVIKDAWSKPVQGSPAHCLIRKQSHTKTSLIRWNSVHFGRIQQKIKTTQALIDKVQHLPPTPSSFSTETNLKITLEELLLQEETLWKQKSRETWLTCSDLNTKFFHSSTVIRRRSNAINFLQSREGGWFSDRADIGGSFVSHFSNLFASTSPEIDEELAELFPPIITADDNILLIAIPTEDEVFKVLSSLGSSKAPGPDGFTALFYQTYWQVVKRDVLECVWDFFLHKQLSKEQNHTFITLIPKQKGAHSVNQFRPISLCNISYKIISKLLANRLKTTLHKIISPLQSAFVPKRNIQDNSIIAHELLHSFNLKRGKGGFMFLKMDMEKAFDKMEWKLILSIMKHLGFHDTWLQWIQTCISSPSFSILLNGSPFGLFSPSRGLRQGDPLSPFLFIMGSELLSRLLLKEERLGKIKGMKIARLSSAINHLLFADDLLLFGKASLLEAASIKACLDTYCSWSGQTINTRKSSIRFSKNTNPSTSSAILQMLPFNPNPNTSIYLGLPILIAGSKGAAFQSILDSIQGKMEGWRAKSLSQAGRLVLIKAVAAAVPSYAMSTFLLPKGFCRKIDQLFKNFWWGFPPEKIRNLSLKSWNSICSPKALGGLGLRKMEEVNLALITKLGWQLLTQVDSLWVAQLKGKYISTGSFLSPPPHSAPSWLWKGILASLPVISQGACHRAHSHSPIPIWNAPWIPSMPSFIPVPLFPGPPNSTNLVLSDLINPNSTWNIPLISSLFDTHSVREIKKTAISSPSISEFLWTPSSSGKFTTSSAYRFISSLRVSAYSTPFVPAQWKQLWKLKLNARLKLFLWKIAWDIVPSKARLQAVFPISPDDSMCPLCNMEEDSLLHLFFNCSFARIAWRSSFWPLDSQAWSSLSLSSWVQGIISPHAAFGIPKDDVHLFQIFSAVLCDRLWFCRNKAIHEGSIPDISKLALSIKKTASAHAAAWGSVAATEEQAWCPPLEGHYKLNFDTAIRDHFSAQAAVCRDHTGAIVKAISQISPPCSPAYGEAQGALLAASLASQMQLSHFVLEGDSQTVISALLFPAIIHDWHIEHLITATLALLSPTSMWDAKKINRSANFCAHHVATWAAARVYSGCIPTFPPLSSPFSFCSGLAPPDVFFPP